MATVAAVYAVAPFVRSGEEFLQSLMPRQPVAKTKKAKTPAVRPRPVAKRVWASLEREPWEVIAEALLEAERHDPERVTRWVVLVDGAETQLDLVEAGAAAYGVDAMVVLDNIHVVEYVWQAAHVFHREGSPELACWAWTRVRDIHEGKASRVAASMRRAATVARFSRDTRKPVDTCADYLLKYAPYLHYDRYLAAGYPIATGVIEGACRHSVRDRMELTGARWRLVGAERGAAEIGLRAGKVINRHKVAKHFVTTITDDTFTFHRDDERIATEQQLDGLYIVRSNVEPEQFDAAQTVRAYKDLSKVERAFRSLKSVDLKVRPIHHRRPDRVRAHILLCMLAYRVEWHMRQALAPLLFDDHDPAAAEQQRRSVVEPAKRSPAALAKAGRKRTDDHLPVHSFRTLLADLGTLTANTMQVTEGGATFKLQTQPTPMQQRCFELLGVTPRL